MMGIEHALATRANTHVAKAHYGRQLPGVIQVGGVSALRDVLLDLGVRPDSIMTAAGVATGIFADPESVIPMAAFGRVLTASVAKTNCAHFGLLVGQRCEASSLGLVGLLAAHSQYVGIALENLVNHLNLYQTGSTPSLSVADGEAALSYVINEPIESADHISDGVLATVFNIMRCLCGRSWHPTQVLLPRRQPADATPFATFFQAPVHFGAESAALVFPAHWLTHVVPGSNPTIRDLLEKRIKKLQSQKEEGFAARLRPIVRTLVLTHQCSAEAAARLFNMSPTTFDRRLAEEGLEFRKMVGEVRYEIARLLLAESSAALTEVAMRLDYSGLSVFVRAFKRWSGRSPADWRDRNVQQTRAASLPTH
jgi:AraC-like DNA-binding protein